MIADAAVRARVRPFGRIAAGDRLPVAAVGVGIAALPLLQPKGPGNTAPVDVVLAVTMLVVLMWASAVRARIRVPYVIPVAIMIVAGAVGGIAGTAPNTAIVALSQEIFLLGWCAAIATVARKPSSLGALLTIWVWSSLAWASVLVVAASAGLRSVAGISGGAGGRARFFFDHPNLAASYFAVSLFVVVLAGRPRSGPWRVAAILVLLTAVVFTGSNAALLGVAAGGIVALAITVAWRVDLVAGVAVLAVACFLALGVGAILERSGATRAVERSGNPYVRYSVARGDRSLGQRLTLFEEQIALFREGTLLGRGPASTREVLDARGVPRAKEAHNDYLAALVERGPLGAVGLVALMAAVALRVAGTGRRALSPAFARIAPGTAALSGAAIMLAVSAAVHEVLHYRHFWALLGILAALHSWGRVHSEVDGRTA